MSDVAIRVEGLGKQYRIGPRLRYKALRDTLTEALYAPARAVQKIQRSAANGHADTGPSTIWALTEVSFEVKRGQVLGVIGRNGAGKSTLLKILSRITDPTEGSIDIYGRVGSLLEVGSGFNPELTGRENIYLNGAILGMKRAEIARKFAEIVDFAEVEAFLDTPVKHYSTGMQTRLAFAVAAHLDPEILVVDEVLAVGDLAFQRKCLGKLDQIGRSGRTILFVSHQLNQIRRLCPLAIWLDHGHLKFAGETAQVLAAYENVLAEPREEGGPPGPGAQADTGFLSWELADADSSAPHTLDSMGPVTVKFVVALDQPMRNGRHGIHLYNSNSQIIWGTGIAGLQLPAGRTEFVYRFAHLHVKPGAYTWLLTIYDEHDKQLDWWYAVPSLNVATTPLGHWQDEWAGLLNLPYSFQTTSIRQDA
jgi:ABC-type polysaccharide/polyol phosphate transport system ATPase subunit